ncbi:MAG: FMN-binding protein [Bacillota bacterium]|jgi:electron transport complex protein RnfG
MKQYFTPVFVLLIICVVVTTALVVTHHLTEPLIEEISNKNADLIRAEVLPEGSDGFTQQHLELLENVKDVYAANNGSGYVITSFGMGFGGEVIVMTGLDQDGKIVGIKVMEHEETPGLGTKVMTPEYLSQYLEQNKITRTGEENATQIEAITGSTVTSDAIFAAADVALAQFAKIPQTGGSDK